MKKDKDKITMKKLIIPGIICILLIFLIPLINWKFYGKFTFDIPDAIAYYENEQRREMDCEWGSQCDSLGGCYCNSAPCKTYNIEGKDCVREGYTDKGFLGFTDFDTEYYVCKEYGRMALSCIDYWDSQKEMMDYYKQKTEETQ